jgi:hypothetical protein
LRFAEFLAFTFLGLTACGLELHRSVSPPSIQVATLGDDGDGGDGSSSFVGTGIANGLAPGSPETDDGCDDGVDRGVDEFGQLIYLDDGTLLDNGVNGPSVSGALKYSDSLTSSCPQCVVLPKGTSRSGLAENGLSQEYLNSEQFQKFFRCWPTRNANIMEHLLRGALAQGESRTIEVRGQKRTFWGRLGLAPQWSIGGKIGLHEARLITAFVGAIINYYGNKVIIGMVSDDLSVGDPNKFSVREGAYFGNIFYGEPDFMPNEFLVTTFGLEYRACSYMPIEYLTSVDWLGGALLRLNCGGKRVILLSTAQCEKRTRQDDPREYYGNCSDARGRVFPETITTFLMKPPPLPPADPAAAP